MTNSDDGLDVEVEVSFITTDNDEAALLALSKVDRVSLVRFLHNEGLKNETIAALSAFLGKVEDSNNLTSAIDETINNFRST